MEVTDKLTQTVVVKQYKSNDGSRIGKQLLEQGTKCIQFVMAVGRKMTELRLRIFSSIIHQ